MATIIFAKLFSLKKYKKWWKDCEGVYRQFLFSLLQRNTNLKLNDLNKEKEYDFKDHSAIWSTMPINGQTYKSQGNFENRANLTTLPEHLLEGKKFN